MKKTWIAILSCLLLVGMILPIGIGAEEAPAPTGIDQNLVIHYDFEGATPAEQLADKAPAGVSKENLSFYSTKDETTQESLSYIKDGIAHIDHSAKNYMQVLFNTENNVGTDALNLATTGEMTLFTAVKVSGSPQAWATFVDYTKVSRLLIQGAKGNNAAFSTLLFRGTTTAFYNDNVEFKLKNADILHDIDTVYIAMTYDYDASTQKLVGSAYLSFDYGKTYTEGHAIFEEVEEFFSQSTYICFGKTRNANQYIVADKDAGSSFDFYDFRLYNKALTSDEIKSIQTGHEPVETPDDPNEGDDLTDDPGEDAITDPVDEETTTAPVTTASTTTAVTDDSEQKSGCGSVISVGAFSMIGVVSAAGLMLTKRKKKQIDR